MNEYEILIETVNPCGGDRHAKREIIEAECESPEAYVEANAPLSGHGHHQDPGGGYPDYYGGRKGEYGEVYVYGVLKTAEVAEMRPPCCFRMVLQGHCILL